MNRPINFEYVYNLEGTKLLIDLGYSVELVVNEKFSRISYNRELKCEIGRCNRDQIILKINSDNSIELNINEYDFCVVSSDANIISKMYPVYKLLEELNIDIKQFYNNAKDNIDEILYRGE